MRFSILLKTLLVYLFISFSHADNTVGLIQNDTDQSFNGYTLFAPNLSKTTYLIDNDGNLVHQWESSVIPGMSAYLLEDGSLLRASQLNDPSGQSNRKGGFQLLDWDGNLLWQFYFGFQHHDIEMLPNGNVLMVTNDLKNQSAATQAGRDPSLLDNNIRSTAIIEIQKIGMESGEIVWQWNAWDHLIQDFDQTKDNFGVVADHPELIDINFATDGGADWLHTNSVDYNEELDQIMVSNRGTGEIWIIDHSTTTEQAATHEGGNSGKGGDLLYRWGNPAAYYTGEGSVQLLFGQHDAHWIESGLQGEGNILIFNNGWPDRGYSSIEEIVPPTDVNGNYPYTQGTAYEPASQLWTYTAPILTDFNSQRFGGSQRLPNGNTLICNSDSGEFFEINKDNEIVWEYQNPVDGNNIIEQGNQPVGNLQVFRCYRYAPDYPGFDGKDLTPGDPIELPANVSVNEEKDLISALKLYENYPNPFNPTTNIEFSLEVGNDVKLVIYDLVGNEVCTLIDCYMEPGIKNIIWNAHDNEGNLVSGGIYLYSLKSGQFTQTRKMLLLK